VSSHLAALAVEQKLSEAIGAVQRVIVHRIDDCVSGVGRESVKGEREREERRAKQNSPSFPPLHTLSFYALRSMIVTGDSPKNCVSGANAPAVAITNDASKAKEEENEKKTVTTFPTPRFPS
jgi:hypothetical protein